MLRKIDWESQIGRRLRLRDLHVFHTVVQQRSMAKAAVALGVSQPAVSEVIADLEHTLGVRLLDRSPQGIEPTQYGRALLKRGVAVFDELKQGVQDIEFLSDPGAGELQIGASAALMEAIVTTVIDRQSRQYPRAVFHLVVGSMQALYANLRERRIELGFTRLYGPSSEEDIDQQVLFEEPLVVVAGMENLWARRRKIEL